MRGEKLGRLIGASVLLVIGALMAWTWWLNNMSASSYRGWKRARGAAVEKFLREELVGVTKISEIEYALQDYKKQFTPDDCRMTAVVDGLNRFGGPAGARVSFRVWSFPDRNGKEQWHCAALETENDQIQRRDGKGCCTGSDSCEVCSDCDACGYCVRGKTCGACSWRKDRRYR